MTDAANSCMLALSPETTNLTVIIQRTPVLNVFFYLVNYIEASLYLADVITNKYNNYIKPFGRDCW